MVFSRKITKRLLIARRCLAHTQARVLEGGWSEKQEVELDRERLSGRAEPRKGKGRNSAVSLTGFGMDDERATKTRDKIRP